jgi:hypothetical protein
MVLKQGARFCTRRAPFFYARLSFPDACVFRDDLGGPIRDPGAGARLPRHGFAAQHRPARSLENRAGLLRRCLRFHSAAPGSGLRDIRGSQQFVAEDLWRKGFSFLLGRVPRPLRRLNPSREVHAEGPEKMARSENPEAQCHLVPTFVKYSHVSASGARTHACRVETHLDACLPAHNASP